VTPAWTCNKSFRITILADGKTVLISGLGVAGPTLAFWLSAAGFRGDLCAEEPLGAVYTQSNYQCGSNSGIRTHRIRQKHCG
jgi:hypothetical protein